MVNRWLTDGRRAADIGRAAGRDDHLASFPEGD
jgi:hypothetical protein